MNTKTSNINIIVFIALALFVCGAMTVVSAAPAFPGAVGFGKNTVGGRSTAATIYFVTRLDDYSSGQTPIPGTLRYALQASGPRIVVFKTGGVVSLKEKINVAHPSVTILGQTAPGDGIAVRNHAIRFQNDQVIMRCVRWRPGDIINTGTKPRPDLLDGIQLSTKEHQSTNLIFDHVSIGWTKDEIAELYFGGKNVTLSNCSFAEPLWHTDNVDPGDPAHGYGPLLDGGFNRADNVTFFRCLMAHSMRRNPWIKAGGGAEIVNCVVYNWDSESMGVWRGSGAAKPNFVNFINNYYKLGPETNAGQKGIIIKDNYTGTQIYVDGCIGPGRPSDTGDDWNCVTVQGAGASYRVNNPVASMNSGIPGIESAAVAFNTVMDNVGAQPRDAHDARVVSNTRNGDGHSIDSVNEIPGPKFQNYPVYAEGTYPTDSDNDGIPNSWETANGLNPNNAADAAQMNSTGYLWIEVYANSLVSDTSGPPPPAPSAPSSPSATAVSNSQINLAWIGRSNLPPAVKRHL